MNKSNEGATIRMKQLNLPKYYLTIALFVVALLFALFVNGALPFYTAPTLGQAVWATGFSQSFVNEASFPFSIYAHNFGAPEPAAMAFGLAGAWPAALFIKFGLHPVDAYSTMIAMWLSIAFISAYKIGRHFSVSPILSVLGALAWLLMPVIWEHSSYSMLSTGIGLLPFYFLGTLSVFTQTMEGSVLNKYKVVQLGVFLSLISLISIFMDGYSFMMFAVGGGLLGLAMFIYQPQDRKGLKFFALPIYAFSLGVAYISYSLFIGKLTFSPASIDFFRGWGVDVTFMLVPTRGLHWLLDYFNWSIPRSGSMFFGDGSVWKTSFSAPIILGSIWAIFSIKSKKSIRMAFILMMLFGFYMALGPSLKVNSVKPTDKAVGALMAEQYAIFPTGSAFISKYLPGFNSMRASYRWGALGVFGAWLLLLLAMSSSNKKQTVVGASLIVCIVSILNLPNLPHKLKNNLHSREMFHNIDVDLLEGMKAKISPGERVAFLPWRNDFLVNYLASRLDIIAFNIGGDKNLAAARQHWPKTMRKMSARTVVDDLENGVQLLLASGEVDVIILPYIDMLWAAHRWPYPAELKSQLLPVINELEHSEFVDIESQDLYAVVRLKESFIPMAGNGEVEAIIKDRAFRDYLNHFKFNLKTHTQVGSVQSGKLVSSGSEGFLHYGPYTSMRAGNYRFVVRGNAKNTSSAWVDFVSNKGKIQHGKFPLAADEYILSEGTINLDKNLNDLEVRVYVGAGDEVVLSGYELISTTKDATPLIKQKVKQ